MSTNGVISFGSSFPYSAPFLFPSYYSSIHFHYAIAPYWSDNDARLNGLVSYQTYSVGESSDSDNTINLVNRFIEMNTSSTNFNGSFMLVVTWSEMHPYPAGESGVAAEPYFNMVGILHSIYIIYQSALLHWF